MVVVMAPNAAAADALAVVESVRSVGGDAIISRGHSGTVIGLIGEVGQFDMRSLRDLDGVADVVPVAAPYKLVSREHHRDRSVVMVGGVPIGPDTMTVIGGLCATGTPEQALAAALLAKAAGAALLRGEAFRTNNSSYACQELGETGLKILADVRDQTGLLIVTEVIDPASVELVASYADMLQVGARSMQNFALLQTVGAMGKPVLLERGTCATIEEWLMAAEYVAQRGNLDIVLCDSGIRTFETTTRNTLDITAVTVAQRLSHMPVLVNPSHSSGRRDLVIMLTRAAIAAGADGVIVDINADHGQAPCDRDSALIDADVREFASVVTNLPPVVGRTLARAR